MSFSNILEAFCERASDEGFSRAHSVDTHVAATPQDPAPRI